MGQKGPRLGIKRAKVEGTASRDNISINMRFLNRKHIAGVRFLFDYSTNAGTAQHDVLPVCNDTGPLFFEEMYCLNNVSKE